jgi:hypothetical protein
VRKGAEVRADDEKQPESSAPKHPRDRRACPQSSPAPKGPCRPSRKARFSGFVRPRHDIPMQPRASGKTVGPSRTRVVRKDSS